MSLAVSLFPPAGVAAWAIASSVLLMGPSARASPLPPPAQHSSSAQGCPKAIEPWTEQLLAALPSYTNRVIQRQRVAGSPPPLYVVVAGAAEILPWPMGEAMGEAPRDPQQPSPTTRYQIFFTTLERQYSRAQTPSASALHSQTLQQFHWLIVSRTLPSAASSQGLPPKPGSFETELPATWQILSMRSQLAPYPADSRLLSPPRDARRGAIAQAIHLWLRDCAAQPFRPSPQSH